MNKKNEKKTIADKMKIARSCNDNNLIYPTNHSNFWSKVVE
jgi:hypothetical protein